MQNFRSLPISSHSTQIDPDQGIIRDVAVAHATEAAGHRLMFDTTTLRQLFDLGNKSSAGIKTRFTHPGLSSDGLGKYLGRMKNFHFEGNRLIADLHLADAPASAPDGNLRQYVLDLAQEDPASFGVSVVTSLEKVWTRANGEEVPAKNPKPEDSLYEYPVARITKFHAADLVDEPALNPNGMFAAEQLVTTNKDFPRKPLTFWMAQLKQLALTTLAFAVACQYFHSRGVDINSVGAGLETCPPPTHPTEGETLSMEQTPVYGQVSDLPTPQPDPNDGAILVSDQLALLTRQVNQIAAQQSEISNQQSQIPRPPQYSGPVIDIGGRAPRGNLSFGPSGLETFQGAWDWLFGALSAKLPSPSLRRTDELYRILTGDIGYQGVFRPEYAFAGASTTTLADMAVNAMNKVIIDLYQALEPYRWYEMITAVQPTDGSLQDMAWIQFGGIATLPTVAEGASYTELTVGDTKESDSFTK
jgi:hypothetical protein